MIEEQKKKEEALGNIKSATMHLTAPIALNVDKMGFKELCIKVGENGLGKSLMNTITYCLIYAANAIVMGQPRIMQLAQLVFDKSLSSPLDGQIACEFTSKVTLNIMFKDGVVEDLTYYKPEEVIIPTKLVYMSTSFRLFTNIKQYLKNKSNLRKINRLEGLKGAEAESKLLMDLLDNYKFYDAMFIEGLLQKVPVTDKSTLAFFNESEWNIGEKVNCIGFEETEHDFYYTTEEKPDKRVYLSTLSNGHQSTLNMLLGSL